MSLTDINDITTQRMVEAARSRNAKPNVDSVALALLDARFRAFEINMRIDAVIAGVREVSRRVEVEIADS
ncbi:hypothetical protein ABIF65_000004 [Bradyrhizobium japonicum]|uniref:Uncharacterized protein n=1 Tax=Bradyrhizobium huanghuaihaiense TaxID=990078 RepID=A0A562QPY1_9BRAD|nr:MULTISPECIES: hypothetical protein [Bradyrhizobium]WLB95758.1 hypothetical protein QIH92_39770 [Bradyrhizobium japonicum USDA 123]MBR0880581.1 hypothetical protein [Bradyrhizobium liaoningense]MBR0998218.1 hypothetical protein [Bradyrhizobium liaoningense]MBR1071186.1 hypothetical protein [Bradyrhizobium liaoningense]MCP1738541.1 hypothetical protein [Bradyrhizobium japonicum]